MATCEYIGRESCAPAAGPRGLRASSDQCSAHRGGGSDRSEWLDTGRGGRGRFFAPQRGARVKQPARDHSLSQPRPGRGARRSSGPAFIPLPPPTVARPPWLCIVVPRCRLTLCRSWPVTTACPPSFTCTCCTCCFTITVWLAPYRIL
jgi:hypothetical protein